MTELEKKYSDELTNELLNVNFDIYLIETRCLRYFRGLLTDESRKSSLVASYYKNTVYIEYHCNRIISIDLTKKRGEKKYNYRGSYYEWGVDKAFVSLIGNDSIDDAIDNIDNLEIEAKKRVIDERARDVEVARKIMKSLNITDAEKFMNIIISIASKKYDYEFLDEIKTK